MWYLNKNVIIMYAASTYNIMIPIIGYKKKKERKKETLCKLYILI